MSTLTAENVQKIADLAKLHIPTDKLPVISSEKNPMSLNLLLEGRG